jgi:hypothetical protein
MMQAEENIDNLNTVCEICGTKFRCDAKNIEDCFCNKIILSKEIIEQIHNKYNRCLCEACLRKWKEEEKEKPIL